MGVYKKEIKLGKPIDVVSSVMDDFMYHEKMIRTDWDGEMVYGDRPESGKNRFLNWSYAGGILYVEAWSKGAFGGKSGPNGGFARELDQVIYRLRNLQTDAISNGHIGSDPINHQGGTDHDYGTFRQDTAWQRTDTQHPVIQHPVIQQPVTLQTPSNLRPLLYALLSCFFAPFFVMLSLAFGIIAWKQGKNSPCRQIIKVLLGFAIFIFVFQFIASFIGASSALRFAQSIFNY